MCSVIMHINQAFLSRICSNAFALVCVLNALTVFDQRTLLSMTTNFKRPHGNCYSVCKQIEAKLLRAKNVVLVFQDTLLTISIDVMSILSSTKQMQFVTYV